ncbi:hypothetical protein [Spirosoma utsteinense]|uniref:Periplasmic heavy metal sensor n=1 Tax=Spirosoma utsteinense TaxID=2585773 RepID=A0ABR6VZK6_9BACT|nr:hypothetical protein [Spirosoma utsteinense]MBC3784521.1 hypothetical protein [Spirosoma utsteinense]MBC3789728.1 hypothetical protein [Spirosoma utsteinense]
MKKVLMTAAMLIALVSTGAMAQRYGYPAPQPNTYPQQQRGYDPNYGQPNYNYDYDDYQFDRHLDWWDRELNLSRRQEREIRRVRDRFDQQTRSINPRDPRQRDVVRQLRQREFFDMMAVLDARQRDRVIERMRPYERVAGRGPGRGNGRGYGNGRGGGYGPYGY